MKNIFNKIGSRSSRDKNNLIKAPVPVQKELKKDNLHIMDSTSDKSIAGEIIWRVIAYGTAIVFLALLQVTVFAKFMPFGATPDFMLTAVITVSMCENERSGTVAGLFAGFIIECIGSIGLTLLPILYMMVGCVCGLATYWYLTDSYAVTAVYVLIGAVVKGMINLVYITAFYGDFSIPVAFVSIIIPEYASTLLLAFIPVAVIRFTARILHGKRKIKNIIDK